jgi:hypothetical protein
MQTADEAGSAEGPDYSFGWGLVNARKAAELILADSLASGMILEESLADGETDRFTFQTTSAEPIRVSIAWTDPAGTPPLPVLNPSDLMLVNDLDLRVERIGGATYQPYVLDPASPATPPQQRTFRDNAEQVYVASHHQNLFGDGRPEKLDRPADLLDRLPRPRSCRASRRALRDRKRRITHVSSVGRRRRRGQLRG